MTGNVDSSPARLGEELAKRGSDGAEGDSPQPARVERIGQCATQMPVPDGLSMRDAHSQENEARLRIPGAERRQLLDVADQLGYQSAQYVSNWERGLTTPPGRTLRKLADLYQIPAEQLYEVILEYTLARTREDLEKEYFGNRKSRR